MGVSGGEEGAVWGPSMMPGGDFESYEHLKPVLEKVAAKAPSDGYPMRHLLRRRWGGPLRKNGPQRHRVRRHGIDRRSVRSAEKYWWVVERRARGCIWPMESRRAAKLPDRDFPKGDQLSRSVQTIRAARRADSRCRRHERHRHLDDRSGAGSLVPIPTIAAAVDSREISGLKAERETASQIPAAGRLRSASRRQKAIHQRCEESSLHCSKICSYAQGMALLSAANAPRTRTATTST